MFLDNNSFLNQLHHLSVEFGPNAKVIDVVQLRGDAIIGGRAMPDSLVDDIRGRTRAILEGCDELAGKAIGLTMGE